MNFLNNIYRPEDIQNYDVASLKILCQEIRQRIIDVVSSTGGHLASNLGVVELTVALHYVFRAPIDKFIFDVSHQSYPHKLLTGRNDKFSTIRQFKGLCGFSNPKESSYDHFYAGHAGTALSLALGMAKSRDMQEENHHIIPILGDASFTCGITLEALNNIPQKLSKFIVILNDNNMSISNNVGAIPRILGSHFFEPFGLSYTGQIDGHDIEKIIETLNSLKNGSGPALLHVLTTKGKGMSQAIENPISYHGCRPFDKSTGLFFSATEKRSTFPQIFGSHILRMAEKDAHIVAVTPAMPAGSCLTAFMKKFPERCLDVGIAEEHAVTFCGGIAHNTHIKVVMSIYATFLQRALDNLFQDVCLQNAPVVFAIDRAGISGPDGSTHHGIYDIAFLRVMPGMIICQPRDGLVLKELLESAFHWKAPTAIRYPNLPTEEKEGPLKYRPPGKAEILHLGQNILIVALGHMCAIALSVHALLQEEEIDATIVDPVFIKPLDEELFSELLATHTHIVTIEEHCVHGGLGSALNSFIASKRLSHIKILNLGIPDLFVEHGSHAELLDALGLSPEKIVKTLVTDFLPCEAPL